MNLGLPSESNLKVVIEHKAPNPFNDLPICVLSRRRAVAPSTKLVFWWRRWTALVALSPGICHSDST